MTLSRRIDVNVPSGKESENGDRHIYVRVCACVCMCVCVNLTSHPKSGALTLSIAVASPNLKMLFDYIMLYE